MGSGVKPLAIATRPAKIGNEGQELKLRADFLRPDTQFLAGAVTGSIGTVLGLEPALASDPISDPG